MTNQVLVGASMGLSPEFVADQAVLRTFTMWQAGGFKGENAEAGAEWRRGVRTPEGEFDSTADWGIITVSVPVVFSAPGKLSTATDLREAMNFVYEHTFKLQADANSQFCREQEST